MDFIISYVYDLQIYVIVESQLSIYGSYSYITSSFGVWNKKSTKGSLRRQLEQTLLKIIYQTFKEKYRFFPFLFFLKTILFLTNKTVNLDDIYLVSSFIPKNLLNNAVFSVKLALLWT